MSAGIIENGLYNKVAGNTANSDIYSTVETPVGTWIDGKTIYRIVISNLSFPEETDIIQEIGEIGCRYTSLSDIGIDDIDTIVSAKFFAYWPESSTMSGNFPLMRRWFTGPAISLVNGSIIK